MEHIPIIEMNIRGMEHHVRTALGNHQMKISSDIETAIEEFFSERNLSALIHGKVCEEVKKVMDKEIEHFFHYGEGRKVIQKKIVERLTNELRAMDEK